MISLIPLASDHQRKLSLYQSTATLPLYIPIIPSSWLTFIHTLVIKPVVSSPKKRPLRIIAQSALPPSAHLDLVRIISNSPPFLVLGTGWQRNTSFW